MADFFNNFGTAPSANLGTERIPVRVEGYILPNGQAESIDNARIIGTRWDTNEPIEIALRSVGGDGDHKAISNFYNDESSSMPVTTHVGGTIVIERAYQDSKLQALQTGSSVPVFNAGWIKRITEKELDGYAVRALIRADLPRPKDVNNPANGYYQTISLIKDRPIQVKDFNALRGLLQRALDGNAVRFDNPQGDWQRPGRPMAMIRMKALDPETRKVIGSQAIELAAQFVDSNQPNMPGKIIMPAAEQVEQLFSQNQFFMGKLAAIQQAVEHPDFELEVLAGSKLSVGPKTIQSDTRNKVPSVQPVTVDGHEGQPIPLYTDAVVGIRISKKSGRPTAIYCKPVKFNPLATRTGLPSPEELQDYQLKQQQAFTAATHQQAAPQQQQQQPPQRMPAAQSTPAAAPQAPQQSYQQPAQQPARQPMQQPAQQPMQQSYQQPAQQPAQQPVRQPMQSNAPRVAAPAPMVVTLKQSEVPATLEAIFPSTEAYQQLKEGMPELSGAMVRGGSVLFSEAKLPEFHATIDAWGQAKGLDVQIVADNAPAAAPVTEDLSNLDFDDLNLDQSLSDAYNTPTIDR